MQYVLGVDLGTSATKTILMDENGTILASRSQTYPLYEPENGWAEQDPLDWRRAVYSTIKAIVAENLVPPEAIAAIGLSGQMHGLVMLEEGGGVLGTSIIWCDQRAAAQTREMLELVPMETWLDITGNPPLAGWTAAKILWVRENEPERFARCRHILLPKDYIRYELTGGFATDVSDASGMQLLDLKNRSWSSHILERLAIPRQLLPQVFESPQVTGRLQPAAAAELGLTTNTVVVAGGSDNACAALGTGVVETGQAFTTIGTSAVVYTHVDRLPHIPDGGLHVCCCAVPGCYHTMGGPQSAGLSLEWFKKEFCSDLIQQEQSGGPSFYDAMNQLAGEIPIGSDHLLYLPFLMGERTPHIRPDYRGAFLGLNTIHTKGHMLRAIMEGISYCLADCNQLLRQQGVQVDTMYACGGGCRSKLWRQMLADLFQCAVRTLEQEEGPAYGSAILAGVGAGLFPDVRQACRRFLREKELTSPNPDSSAAYAAYHRLYDRFYESLAGPYAELAGLP